MITGFRHKGLEAFYKTETTRGIQAAHAEKLRRILGLLDVAECPKDLNVPSFQLHSLKGKMKDYFSIKVNGNWQVTFCLTGSNIELVDYHDYH